MIRGIPIRIAEGGYSVDGMIAADRLPMQEVGPPNQRFRLVPNPYFNHSEPFRASKFGFTLVTRLDGYTKADVRALIDHALVAHAVKGPFLFAGAENRNSASYGELQQTLIRGQALLKTRGFDARYESGPEFPGSDVPLAGYASWGSNDGHFKSSTYHALTFRPGAIGETFVSTSGRSFRPLRDGGQSLIADLISQGITGVKGYVSEPFTFALARADILFDRYTRGFNLAESFYSASPVLKWKDVVIGDPLCAPYRSTR
jgi:uncharacterized protein (TIGR03790 family)